MSEKEALASFMQEVGEHHEAQKAEAEQAKQALQQKATEETYNSFQGLFRTQHVEPAAQPTPVQGSKKPRQQAGRGEAPLHVQTMHHLVSTGKRDVDNPSQFLQGKGATLQHDIAFLKLVANGYCPTIREINALAVKLCEEKQIQKTATDLPGNQYTRHLNAGVVEIVTPGSIRGKTNAATFGLTEKGLQLAIQLGYITEDASKEDEDAVVEPTQTTEATE